MKSYFLLLSALSCCYSSVFVQAQNGISISSFPSPLYFKTGDSLSIICEYSGDLVFQHWLHPTDGIIAASQGRKAIQVFDTIIFLIIIDAQESDGGDYRCVFKQGDATNESLPLSAFYRVPITLHSPASSNSTVTEGEDLSLACGASNFSSRRWVKVSDPQMPVEVVANSSDGRIVITHDFQLQFREIQLEDKAIYRCELRNDIGQTQIEVNVQVIDAASEGCELNRNKCDLNASCTNTTGSFTCTCNQGYSGDGVTCADIDECVALTDNCDLSAECTNTPGSFTCTCSQGYSGDGVTCDDVNECLFENCGSNSTCTNTPGSFTCACDQGYSGDGKVCLDIDECETDGDECDLNASCMNTPGSFTCACNQGYSGDGLTCNDIDECVVGSHNCDPNARCTNTPGSFTCACNQGYSGDGFTCEGLDVSITISYTPPDQYPDYSPPNYRAASSVTLTCVASRTNGSVSYSWSSTCNGCFTSSSSSSIVSETLLRTRDAGVHTCTVTDSRGIKGSASIQMNIVGIGIHLVKYYTALRDGPNPNNTFASVDTTYSQKRYQRLDFYCCSNSNSSNFGFLKTPSGVVHYDSFQDFQLIKHTSSSEYAGCMQVVISTSQSTNNTLPESGVYTCQLLDNTGKAREAMIALYPQDYNVLPTVYILRTGSLAISCFSSGIPPTNISWYRNGKRISANGGTVRTSQQVTDYGRSSYNNTIFIGGDEVVGSFHCQISDHFGRRNSSHVSIQGAQITTTVNYSNLMIGRSFSLSCYSDLEVSSIELFYGNRSVLESFRNRQITFRHSLVSTDDEGVLYRCLVTSQTDSVILEKNITLSVGAIPHRWGSVSITTRSASNVLTLVCTVRPITGMRLIPSIEWVGPNGTVVESDGNRTVGELMTQGRVHTLPLSFDPFDPSYGGRYTCRAAVSVPWKDVQPPTISSSYDLPVTDLNVSISISYTPPDQYPDYSPPNYRAASSVILTCVVSNAVASVSYRWSSTCRSCFASSSSSSSISESMLRSRDAGVHTCTVTDGIGNRKNVSIQMNIVGIGIHLTTYNSAFTSGSNPNNSYATVIERYSSLSLTRLNLYCCSNSTASNVGSFLAPGGQSFRHTIYRFSSTNSYAGCIRVSISTSRYRSFSLSPIGIHTCRIPDSSGRNQTAMLGLYNRVSGSHELRLVGSSNSNRGRLEIYYNGVWGTVCDDSFGSTEATVACRQLGYSGYSRYGNVGALGYSRGTGRIWLDDVDCSSSSTRLSACRHRGWGSHNCGHSEDVALQCSGGTSVITTNITISHILSLSSLTVTCQSTGIPPTFITWYRNGRSIDIDGNNYKQTKQVTNPRTSHYNNTLLISGVPLRDMIGRYYCHILLNKTSGRSSSSIAISVQALQIGTTGHTSNLLIGSRLGLNCSNVIEVEYLEWYRASLNLTRSYEGFSSITHFVSTDDQNVQFRCLGMTPGGHIVDNNITLSVRVPDAWGTSVINANSTGGARNGSGYTLLCNLNVIAGMTLPPTMKWVGPDGTVVRSDGNRTVVGIVRTQGTVSTISLSFNPVLITDAGMYICRAAVTLPQSFYQPRNLMTSFNMPVAKSLQVSIVAESLPSSSPLYYVGIPLTLTCAARGGSSSSSVQYKWTSSCTGNCFLKERDVNSKNISTNSLQLSDSGVYTCTVCDDRSDCENSTIAITVSVIDIKVSISISYTPPDQYPDYSPPNYRAASSVHLTCVVSGAAGSVAYRWSSTCRGCFASKSSSSVVSENLLRSRDAGVHTCTVTDSLGNKANASTRMNIHGIGIYVFHYKTGHALGPNPNNTFAVVDTGSSNYNNQRLGFYCCSGSISSSIGSFIRPSGDVILNNRDFEVFRYGNGSAFAGCMRVTINRPWFKSYSFSENGVYRCRLPNSRGRLREAMIGLYNTRPRGYSRFNRVRSTEGLTLTCASYSEVPTGIVFYKNNTRISVDGFMYSVSQRVTNFATTSYETTLLIRGDPVRDIIGRYSCGLTGGRRNHITIQGLQVRTSRRVSSWRIGSYLQSISTTNLEIGWRIELTCSSDFDITSVDWYRGFNRIQRSNSSQSTLVRQSITTDDHGSVYRCFVRSPYAIQYENIRLSVRVPSSWGSISSSQRGNALHGVQFTIQCTVNANSGIRLRPLMEWVGPDGSVVESEENRTMVELRKSGLHRYTLSLSFNPALSSDGGRYTCRANLSVPWMDVQPRLLQSSYDLTVNTRASFQLRVYPVPQCTNSYGLRLDSVIRSEVSRVVAQRCRCSFISNQIDNAELRCQISKNSVIFRAAVNGHNNMNASQIVEHIENWHTTQGSFVDNEGYRLNLDKDCPVAIKSLRDEEECT